jgi:hypothetical protein
MICDRCKQETGAYTGSFFNMEIICLECSDRERAHPKFEEARRIETEATLQGEFNFPGIGLPPDLQARILKEEKP